jgi:iron transport multicopper oxidase
MTEDIAPTYLSLYNPTGGEPLPQSFLFNDTLNSSLPVKPNTTYLLRLINTGAFIAQYFYIEGHTFQIVEIDGVYTNPTEADTLYIAVAQRYSILLTTKATTDTNYAIVTVVDSVLLDTIPSNLQLNYTNWLEYNKEAPHLQAVVNVSVATDLVPFDDLTLVPRDNMPLLPEPDYEVNVTVSFGNLMSGFNYGFLNNITYTPPKVPILYTVLSSGALATNSEVYGEFTHPFVLNHNDVVQLVLNNDDVGTHPFHLHGHNFQVIDRAPSYGPNFYSNLNAGSPVPYDPANHTAFPAVPARRDTFVLPPLGYYVIRFVASNPGVWTFHCHIDWHLSAGLAMTFIDAPLQIQERVNVPQQHFDVCKAGGVPYVGNAAGNDKDLLDLTGQNAPPAPLPNGFTSRGIVALIFSVISALLGMGSIVVYGLSDLKFHVKGSGNANVDMVETPPEGEVAEISVQPKVEGYRD